MKTFQAKIDKTSSVRQQLELLTEEVANLFQPSKILCKLSDSGFNFLSPPLEWSGENSEDLIESEDFSSFALLTALKRKRIDGSLGLEKIKYDAGYLYTVVADYQGIPEIDICIVREEPLRDYEEEKLIKLLSGACYSIRKTRLELLSIRRSKSSDSRQEQESLRILQGENRLAEAGVLKLEVGPDGYVIRSNSLASTFGIIGYDFGSEERGLRVTHPDLQNAIQKVSADSPSLIQRISIKKEGETRVYLMHLSYELSQNIITLIGTDVSAEHKFSTIMRRQEEGYSAISKVVLASSDIDNLEDYLDNVLPLLASALNAKAGLIIVDSEHKDGAPCLATFNIDNFTLEGFVGSDFADLIAWANRSKEVVVIPHLTKDKGPFSFLSDVCTPSNCIVCPLSYGQHQLGVIVLVYPFKDVVFDDSFLILVKTVTAHISGAIDQMRLIQETKINQKTIQALYRLSHELSQFLTLEQVFQKAFEIMQSELGIDRFWLGLLNETGTRLIGSSAFGEGWKKKLVEVNIDVSEDSHPLAKVIRAKKAILLNDSGDILKGLGLKRFITRNEIDSVGIVPLVAGGQILGVLAFEGEKQGRALSEYDLNILSSFATELASVLLAKKLEERVTAGETMRASGLLAAGIAHNFNNLLQGILGQASLIELYASKPEQVVKSAKLISEASTKGAGLVKQLMSFAHLEEPQSEEVDLNAMIDRNKASFQRLLRDRQYIVYSIQKDIPRSFADPSQVLRILQVLVSNARDAMKDDGRLEFITDYIEIDKNSPHYEVPYGKYVRIGVRDDGIGMDLETKRRCFEPFFSTKNIDPGSGLSLSGEGMGLAAGFALAKKNGGRLVVDSRKGHGSLFTLYLPIDASRKQVRTSEKAGLSERIEIEPIRSEDPLTDNSLVAKHLIKRIEGEDI